MGSKFQIKISGTSNGGSISVQSGTKAAGSVTFATSGETSTGVRTTSQLASSDAQVSLKQGAIVGAVSMQPGVPAEGHVTILADRLPKRPEPEGDPSSEGVVPERRGMPKMVWIVVAVALVVAVLVLATR